MRRLVITGIGLIFSLSFNLTVIGQSPVAESIDSLFILRSRSSDIERANIDLEIARYHFLKNQDSLLHYISLLEKHLSFNYDIRIDAFVHKFKGYEAYQSLDHEKSIRLTKKSLALFREIDDYKEIGWLLINLGTTYSRFGDLANATEKILEALDYFQQIDHKAGIGAAYNMLGKISYQSDQPIKAQEYYKLGLKSYSGLQVESPMYQIYNNLGQLLLSTGDINEALSNFKEAARGFQILNDQRRLAIAYGNIALCYEQIGQRDTAVAYSREALQLSTKAEDRYGIISGTINLGNFLRLQQEYDSSKLFFDRVLNMAIEREITELEAQVYEKYEALYVQLNDYETAYNYRMKFDSAQRVLFDENTLRRIEELSFRHKYRREDMEMRALRAHEKMQSRINKILISLILLFMFLSTILILAFAQNRKQKRLLSQNNSLLNKYNLELRKSEAELLKLVEEKNRLFTIIAHDLRNPVAAVAGFTELLHENYNELDEPRRKEYINHILNGTNRSMSLLENLLLWARSQMNIIETNRLEIKVSKLILEGTNPLMSAIEKKDLELTTDIEDDFLLYIDAEMIKAVIRNLVSNAIKFSFPESVIIIKAYKRDNKLCIAIKDHGTGIETKLLEQLFSADIITTIPGTLNESGSGLGLQIAKDYTEKNGGILTVESAEGEGAEFTICFPEKND